MKKYEKFITDQSKNNPRPLISLWTLGTSLPNTPFDRSIFKFFWRKFTMRMANYSKYYSIPYEPLVRAFEAGSRGGRLHVHFILQGYWKHSCDYWAIIYELRDIYEQWVKKRCTSQCITCIWRSITGENSNVNFQQKEYNNALLAFAYCAKYISKNGNYSYMGNFRLTKV
jgi:hypothetical protein